MQIAKLIEKPYMTLFEKCFYKGFKLNNCNDSFNLIKEKIRNKQFNLQKSCNDNFFFYDNTDNLTYYFVNDLKNYNLEPSYVKIFTKTQTQSLKHFEFLEINHFKELLSHKEMVLKNENLITPLHTSLLFPFISNALYEDSEELYHFFTKYFEKYLFYFPKESLKNKIKDIFIYKENEKICGALIYTQTLNTAFLDFIAVDRNLKHKNVAFALLNHYFSKNQQSKFFKLFVDEKNEKAVNFYKRAGFDFKPTRLKFYKNF